MRSSNCFDCEIKCRFTARLPPTRRVSFGGGDVEHCYAFEEADKNVRNLRNSVDRSYFRECVSPIAIRQKYRFQEKHQFAGKAKHKSKCA